jgi:predicted anti-sigma-YlaC factor YlaD
MENNHCQHLLQSLSDYIDGTLDPSLCALLEEHLCGCENCQVVYNTTLKTIDLYHTVESHETLPGEVRERLFMRLNLEDYLGKNDAPIRKMDPESHK